MGFGREFSKRFMHHSSVTTMVSVPQPASWSQQPDPVSADLRPDRFPGRVGPGGVVQSSCVERESSHDRTRREFAAWASDSRDGTRRRDQDAPRTATRPSRPSSEPPGPESVPSRSSDRDPSGHHEMRLSYVRFRAFPALEAHTDGLCRMRGTGAGTVSASGHGGDHPGGGFLRSRRSSRGHQTALRPKMVIEYVRFSAGRHAHHVAGCLGLVPRSGFPRHGLTCAHGGISPARRRMPVRKRSPGKGRGTA